MTKLVYDFAEGNREMKDLLGGKGANLSEMTVLGLPVPPGFVISTEACKTYLQTGDVPTELAQEVRGLGNSLLQALEKKDAEAMSLLRSELEIKVLNAVKDMKSLQIKETNEQIEILKRTKLVTQERQIFYSGIQKIIPKEQLNLDKLGEAND